MAHRRSDVEGSILSIVFSVHVGPLVEEPLQGWYRGTHQTRLEHGRAPCVRRGVDVRTPFIQPFGHVEPVLHDDTGQGGDPIFVRETNARPVLIE